MKSEMDKIDSYYSYHTTLILEIVVANDYFWKTQSNQISLFHNKNEYLNSLNKRQDKFDKLGFDPFEKIDLINEYILKMSLIYLFSLFEAFNKDLFQILFFNEPYLMKSKNKKLDYETILNFSDINELHEFLSHKEVEKYGYYDIDELSKLLVETFNINLEDDFEYWNELRENYYRRNIIVHNDGKVSRIYLNKLNLLDKELSKELSIDKFYIGDCCRNIKNYMSFISESIRKKFNIDSFI